MVVVIMISLTIANTSFFPIPAVLAQEQEEQEFNEDCAKLVDEVKGLDRKRISCNWQIMENFKIYGYHY
jgi:hypothetical protein